MITIDIQDRPILAALTRLEAKLADMTPVMDAIGQRLEEHISLRFETETDPLDRPWAEWARSTRERYPKDGHRRILDRHGDLLKGLNHQADRAGVTVGFGQPYAAYHEYGTHKMPRRGLLTADPATGELAAVDRRAILDLLGGWLDP